MNTKRLLETADLLDKVRPKHFDLRSWASSENFAGEDTPLELGLKAASAGIDKKEYVEQSLDFERLGITCGTTACAFGWAASHKPFQKQGLKMEIVKDGREFLPIVTFEGREGFDAAMAFYDLNSNAAHLLFADWLYLTCKNITPKMVGRRIRRLVKLYQRDPDGFEDDIANNYGKYQRKWI